MHEAFETTMWSLVELVVVDAVDDGEVGAVGRRRDQHALGAGGQMRRGLVLGGEDAGAFERDVDAEVLPRQLGGIALGGDLDRAVADARCVSPSTVTSPGKRPCTRVEAQQVRVGLDRAEIVDGDDLDVLAPASTMARRTLRPMRPKPLMATRTVMSVAPGYSACHGRMGHDCIDASSFAKLASAASATASGVMPKCL